MNLNEKKVIEYYNTLESRHGYKIVLQGTKHFGYYKINDKPWQFKKALRQMEDQLAKTLSLPKFSKCLDAGCGMSDVACYLAKYYQLKIEGIDLLDFNINEAKKRIKKRKLENLVHVQEMNYMDLKFPDNTFDGVYTVETFVHASDPVKVLKEFYRVLKPDGRIVMFEYSKDPDNKMTKRAIRVFKKVNELAAMPAFQNFDHGVQEKLMQNVGFKNVQVKDITSNVLPMVRVFNFMAVVPYKILNLIHKQDNFVNIMSAVEYWRYRKHVRYNIYSANKPF